MAKLCPRSEERVVNGQKVRVSVFPPDPRREFPTSRFQFREIDEPIINRSVIFLELRGESYKVRHHAAGIVWLSADEAHIYNLARIQRGDRVMVELPRWYAIQKGLA